MQDKVSWLTYNPYALKNILPFYKYSEFSPVFNFTDEAAALDIATRCKNDYNKIILNINYQSITIDQLISLNKSLPENVFVQVWTIDDIEIYKQYLPYVYGITSNKINEYML